MNRFFKGFMTWLCLAAMMVGTLSVGFAAEGDEEKSDTVVFTVEAATTGYGYLLKPMVVTLEEGDTIATIFDRVMTAEGFSYLAAGTVEEGMYVKAIAPGGVLESGANTASGEGAEMNVPKRLGDEVPQIIFDSIADTLELETVEDFEDGWGHGDGSLGEYDYSFMTGWMVSLNNVFESTGMSETPVKAGDVVRVQYTMGWGSDLGPNWGFDYFETADKGAISIVMAEAKAAEDAAELLADAKVAAAYAEAVKAAMTVDADQATVDAAKEALEAAIEEYRASQEETPEEPNPVEPENPTPEPENPTPEPTPAPGTDKNPQTGDVNWNLVVVCAGLAMTAAIGTKMARKVER